MFLLTMVDCLKKNGRNGMEVVPLFLLAIICFIIEQLKKCRRRRLSTLLKFLF